MLKFFIFLNVSELMPLVFHSHRLCLKVQIVAVIVNGLGSPIYVESHFG